MSEPIPLTPEQEAERIEYEKRKEAGKKGQLWRLACYYELNDPTAKNEPKKEKRVLYHDNLYTHEMKAIRENAFSIGLMVPVGMGEWRVIPPWDLGPMKIYLQSKFFE